MGLSLSSGTSNQAGSRISVERGLTKNAKFYDKLNDKKNKKLNYYFKQELNPSE